MTEIDQRTSGLAPATEERLDSMIGPGDNCQFRTKYSHGASGLLEHLAGPPGTRPARGTVIRTRQWSQNISMNRGFNTTSAVCGSWLHPVGPEAGEHHETVYRRTKGRGGISVNFPKSRDVY